MLGCNTGCCRVSAFLLGIGDSFSVGRSRNRLLLRPTGRVTRTSARFKAAAYAWDCGSLLSRITNGSVPTAGVSNASVKVAIVMLVVTGVILSGLLMLSMASRIITNEKQTKNKRLDRTKLKGNVMIQR